MSESTTPTLTGELVQDEPKYTPRKNMYHYVENRQEVCEKILDLLSRGMSLSEICKLDGVPERKYVHAWMEKDNEFAKAFERAKMIGCDALMESADKVLKKLKRKIFKSKRPGEEGMLRIDPGLVQLGKVEIDHIRKKAAQINPAKYGEKIDIKTTLSVEGGGITALLAATRSAGMKTIEGDVVNSSISE